MRSIASLAAAALAAVVFATPQMAFAIGAGGLAHGLKSSPVIKYVVARGPTLAPFAHVVFCMRLPGECQKADGADVADADAKNMAVLSSVNEAVNRAIRPKYDTVSSGTGDDWELSPTSGDCEDYAITKRHQLISQGWPARSLRLAVVKTSWGEGHAVLVVKTSEGDLVLDNLTSAIKPFQKTGLRFLKIQSDDNPRMWLAL